MYSSYSSFTVRFEQLTAYLTVFTFYSPTNILWVSLNASFINVLLYMLNSNSNMQHSLFLQPIDTSFDFYPCTLISCVGKLHYFSLEKAKVICRGKKTGGGKIVPHSDL